ncbi:HAMP domain-containing sensor histidine kinase [Halobacteriovorax sp. HLS]|uniref:sensor histidine kinase n=1 Tax=Halobacteriovorax sp. HLS TaxID=2234000 RepID=UPI000FDB794B|nr:HAMP domain-containing sensor histidine kinase [Halobacteriovorax sp. HLS]
MAKKSFFRSTYKKDLLLYSIISVSIIQLVFLYRFYFDGFLICVYFLLPFIPINTAAIILLKKHERHYSSYMICFSGALTAVTLIWLFGGFKAPAPFWIAFSPLFFGALFGRKSLPVSIAYMLSSYAIFYFFDSPIQLQPKAYLEEKLVNLAMLSLIIPIVVYGYLNSFDKYQRNLNEQYRRNKKLLRVLLHDISNPLSVIRFIHKKIKASIDPTLAQKLEANSSAIYKIIDDVKLYEEGSSNKERFFKEVISADCVLKDIHNIFDEIAHKKGVSIIVENFLSDEIQIKTNLGLLQNQILYNLISNAIKFTPKGSNVTIRANCIGGKVVFEVLDEGPGIEKSKIILLDSDQRIHSSLGTDGELGSGYGLGLVVYFLKNLGGELDVLTSETESEISLGTLFRIQIPEYITP